MDENLRRRQRGSDTLKGDAAALAGFLRERQRRGETAADLAGRLAEYSSSTRKAVFRLLEMNEDDQMMQEALILFDQQIYNALKSAIQPQEGDASLPDRQSILQSIHQCLTLEQAKIFLNRLEIHEPKLVLVPITSMERYLQELQTASQTMEGSQEPLFSDFAQDQLHAQATAAEVEGNQIKYWKLAITEGAKTFDIPDWDNGQETFQERINRFNRKFVQSGMLRLDYRSYIALMIDGLRGGKPIDGDQYSILNEMDEQQSFAGVVAIGEWLAGVVYVFLNEKGLYYRYTRARFRPSVVMDIP